ncbi:MAG: cytochrome C oxidase subunit IV family protein [Candidatus Omnitrophica bacterium]|nr:cytochrome C oxidase subunit IV family protein [Candidatus Omnitrophota bacterium]
MEQVQQSNVTSQEAVHQRPNYAAIFWALLILTILEIIVANLPASKPLAVAGLVFLAIVKASLVALFYMHLKFEKFVIYLIVIFPLFLAVVLTLMILADQAPKLPA